MKYQTMRIDHLKHLNIEALIGNVELTVNGETLTIKPVAPEKKPRTKVEYVKCEYGDKASNIVMDFENNAPLYKVVNDEYWTIDELDDLFAIILDGGEHIYRRIETPITEREAFIEVGIEILKDVNPYALGKLFDSGKFKLVN